MRIGENKKCKIIGCFVGESKEKKTPYYGIEFENQEGESIEHAFYLSDKTKEKNIALLIEMGFVGKSFADLANPKFTVDQLFATIQDDINVVIDEEPYQRADGTTGLKKIVKWVNVGSIGLSKADYATAVMIAKNNSFEGLIVEFRKNKKTSRQVTMEAKEKRQEASEPLNATSDDVPF